MAKSEGVYVYIYGTRFKGESITVVWNLLKRYIQVFLYDTIKTGQQQENIYERTHTVRR